MGKRTEVYNRAESSFGKTLYYLREQWPYLVRYHDDGRLEISTTTPSTV